MLLNQAPLPKHLIMFSKCCWRAAKMLPQPVHTMSYFNKVPGHHQGLGLACATPWVLAVLRVL